MIGPPNPARTCNSGRRLAAWAHLSRWYMDVIEPDEMTPLDAPPLIASGGVVPLPLGRGYRDCVVRVVPREVEPTRR